MHPAYGMAEATVLIAAGTRAAAPVTRRLSRAGLQDNRVTVPEDEADAQVAVGSGRALVDERIAIVDPEDRSRLGADEIGEIWVAGPNVAQGYWANRVATKEAFGAAIAGEGEAVWLRTGDLGFLDAAGELFVTGRIKDIVIIRGANHYPQDIEHTVETAHPALAAHAGAAFAVTDERGDERLVVVQEVERSQRHHAEHAQLVTRIREAVVSEHDIVPFAVTLLRPGALPKTTSGKIQRAQSRRLWLEGGLDIL
jgi:acyl-CoA synthetase (AMP-forming)/AMP-acid ligase II